MDPEYKKQKDAARTRIDSRYKISGFISSGTYGKVYRASHIATGKDVAIKKFKPEKDFDPHASAFSQSACREIALCRELRHENVVSLDEVMIDPADRSIYMVFDYAEHDLLQILHHHGHTERKPVPEPIAKSLLYQLINGVAYLHANWVLHRDLKPANILLSPTGTVKIGDLGLARLFQQPLLPLFSGDKVVVTIWYRSPELLLGARHYTKAVDMWAVGCIFAELLILRPLFKGEEAKMDSKKNIPFQRHQLLKIFEVLGTPVPQPQGGGIAGMGAMGGEWAQPVWKGMDWMPEYHNLKGFPNYPPALRKVIHQSAPHFRSERGFDLLARMLEYDPNKRITAEQALQHSYFLQEEPQPIMNPFAVNNTEYPLRKITPLEPSDDHVAAQQAVAKATGVVNPTSVVGPFSGSLLQQIQVPLMVQSQTYVGATQLTNPYTKVSGSRLATLPPQFAHLQSSGASHSRAVSHLLTTRQPHNVALSHSKLATSAPPSLPMQVTLGVPVPPGVAHARTAAPGAALSIASNSRGSSVQLSTGVTVPRGKAYALPSAPQSMGGHVVSQQGGSVGNASSFQVSQALLGHVAQGPAWTQTTMANGTISLNAGSIPGFPHQVVLQGGQKRKRQG